MKAGSAEYVSEKTDGRVMRPSQPNALDIFQHCIVVDMAIGIVDCKGIYARLYLINCIAKCFTCI